MTVRGWIVGPNTLNGLKNEIIQNIHGKNPKTKNPIKVKFIVEEA